MAKAKKKINREEDIRIHKINNGFTVTTYDKDYNHSIQFCSTRDEVIAHIEGLEF